VTVHFRPSATFGSTPRLTVPLKTKSRCRSFKRELALQEEQDARRPEPPPRSSCVNDAAGNTSATELKISGTREVRAPTGFTRVHLVGGGKVWMTKTMGWLASTWP